jgi:hypothetical protein
MSVTNRPASHAFHSTVPSNAILNKLCKYIPNQNIGNKLLIFHTGLLQTRECPLGKHRAPHSLDQHLTSLQHKSFFCNTASVQNSYAENMFKGQSPVTWNPEIPSPRKIVSLETWVSLLRIIITSMLFTHHSPCIIQISVAHRMWHLSVVVCVLDGTGQIITPGKTADTWPFFCPLF